MPSIASTALAATPIAAAPTNPDPAAAIAAAARLLLPDLERGRRIDAAMLRAAMEHTLGGSDAEGTWDWKTAYDACEAATVLFLRNFGSAMCAKAHSPAAMLPMVAKIGGFCRRIRAAPRRAGRSSNSRRRSRSVSRRAPPPQSRRQTWCWSHRPGRACSQSSPSWRVAVSFSTNWLTCVPGCWIASFRASPSHGSTRRRSMTISAPACAPAWC